MRKLVRVIALAFVVFALMAWGNGSSKSAYAESSQSDLTELSLEELMNLTVTLVSRKPQKISQAAAAIFVITQDDIRRSGVTTIPDALRMAPGLFVGRIDANKWSISARGFNGRFSNKLLVLMDGRSVYTPLFSGVNWDVQDTMLEDVERIEVIRGPGASLWGANAVNGIIQHHHQASQGYPRGAAIDGRWNRRTGIRRRTLWLEAGR